MLKPGDTVVVPRIDCLARNLTEGLRSIEQLHGQGINIRSLAEGLDTGDDSPTSRLMLHMLLSLAEWERDTIRDRIRTGVDRAAAEGRTGERPPALSSEKMEAVKAFLENGGSVSATARTFGVSRPTCAPFGTEPTRANTTQLDAVASTSLSTVQRGAHGESQKCSRSQCPGTGRFTCGITSNNCPGFSVC